MRILTYNIWNYSGEWQRRSNLLVDIIRDLDPEIIALQEVRHSWRDPPGKNQALWLADRLGYSAAYRPANVYWPLPPVTEGLAFLTKRPLARLNWYAVPRLAGSGPRRVILHATVDGLDIYNAHFPLTERARNVAARHLTALVADTAIGPAIALGDFNADIYQVPMRMLLEAGFVDLWTQLGSGARTQVWPDKRRIDYILGYGASVWTGTISAVGAVEKGLRPSDHVGIAAEVAPA